MDELLQTLVEVANIHESFRVWITTEGHPLFPISLLQASIKFTNEPPLGIKAGLKRTYADITQEYLDISNMHQWKPMLYAVSFLHTVVQVLLPIPTISMRTWGLIVKCLLPVLYIKDIVFSNSVSPTENYTVELFPVIMM